MDTPRTREAIGLPPAAIPADVLDQRFQQHGARRRLCDNCGVYCTGRARDYLPGSFAFAIDNTHAGPPKDRKGCFPTPAIREEQWLTGMWNATYLCRSCLVREWDQPTCDIDKWLEMHRTGAQKPYSRWKSTQWQAEPQRHYGGSQWQYGRWQSAAVSGSQRHYGGSQWHDVRWSSGWSSGGDRWR